MRTVHGESSALYEPTLLPITVHSLQLSAPERTAIGLAVVLLAVHGCLPGDALEYRRGILVHEPWRLLTGHFVHINWAHAAMNALALWIVARLFAADLTVRRMAIALLASALAISAVIAGLYPAIEWYRGLSGALHGLFFAGATTWLLSEHPRSLGRLWLPAALLAGGWAKVLLEQQPVGALPRADWLGAAIVPQAHLVGAACGTLLGALFAATTARDREKRGER